ncbi:MAG: 1-acyl-sn-glycerol-3-phosphate acyltransferase [Planctomycetes bacterium]|nr:1-acyl-sn-glycerol-3-phosphate acyltransferase [Planctomycetota bacterium]
MSATEEREVESPVEVRMDKTLTYHFLRSVCWLFLKLYCRMRIEGAEKLPKSGGCVLAANHASHLDIPILSTTTLRHVAFVARDTLDESRFLSFIMRETRAVLVKRGTADRRAIRAMVDHLAVGDCVAIYPEGTRTHDGKLGELKGGALLAARMGKVPIVPIGLDGSYRLLSRHMKFPRPAKLVVRVGDPIDSSLPDAQERLLAALHELSRT